MASVLPNPPAPFLPGPYTLPPRELRGLHALPEHMLIVIPMNALTILISLEGRKQAARSPLGSGQSGPGVGVAANAYVWSSRWPF